LWVCFDEVGSVRTYVRDEIKEIVEVPFIMINLSQKTSMGAVDKFFLDNPFRNRGLLAPAANDRLALVGRISHCENQAAVDSETFPKGLSAKFSGYCVPVQGSGEDRILFNERSICRTLSVVPRWSATGKDNGVNVEHSSTNISRRPPDESHFSYDPEIMLRAPVNTSLSSALS
jgi:hypothetical protein